jgi:hypothetical protein
MDPRVEELPRRGPGRIRRYLRWPLRLFVGYCLGHLALVLVFPQLLFTQSITRHDLTARSREPIAPEMNQVLDRVHSLISASELFEPDVRREIVLINSFALSRYLLLRNVHFGCNMPTGSTFITNGDAQRDIAYCERGGHGDRRLRSLSDSIAHEITHAMIRDRVGIRHERRLPSWLKEGYCEYVAQGSSIDHELGLGLLTRNAPGFTPGLANFKYRLMVEHVLLGRGESLTSLLGAPPDARNVEADLFAALDDDPRAYLESIGSTIGQLDPVEHLREEP